jgi:hypothetical protein
MLCNVGSSSSSPDFMRYSMPLMNPVRRVPAASHAIITKLHIMSLCVAVAAAVTSAIATPCAGVAAGLSMSGRSGGGGDGLTPEQIKQKVSQGERHTTMRSLCQLRVCCARRLCSALRGIAQYRMS